MIKYLQSIFFHSCERGDIHKILQATLVQLDGSIIVLKATISCDKIKAILAEYRNKGIIVISVQLFVPL